jgi:DNA-binding transcriptional LysR family regulator
MRGSKTLDHSNLAQVHSFYWAAKHGSFGAAARLEGRSLPTLSRHIASLEAALNVTLFDRQTTGLVLTEPGSKLFQYAEAVHEAGARFDLAANGQADVVAGDVSVSASRSFAFNYLPKVLQRLGAEQPSINFELVVTDATTNLLMREADIAIRMYRPQQASLIAKKIGDIRLGMYASKQYLDIHSTPTSFEELQRYSVIGDANSDQVNAGLSAMGVSIDHEFFRYRCEDPAMAWNLVLSGCGIGLGHINVAEQVPSVKRLMPETVEFVLPVWLTSHAELRTSARVRRVFDCLAHELKQILR